MESLRAIESIGSHAYVSSSHEAMPTADSSSAAQTRIGGDSIHFRSIRESDVPILNKSIDADPYAQKYVFPKGSIDRVYHQSLSDRTVHAMVIDDRGVPSGLVSSRGPSDTRMLAYWLAPNVRGKGVATAAVQHMTNSLFQDKNIESVALGIKHENMKSQRVAERAGFIKDDETSEAQIWLRERETRATS